MATLTLSAGAPLICNTTGAAPTLKRTLLRSPGQLGLWSVNHVATLVYPGVVVGFLNEADALYFLNQGRGLRPRVEVGSVLAFDEEGDASHFIARRVAQRVSDEEARKFLDQARGTPSTSVVALKQVNGRHAAVR